jgi:tetratricopeptide (TPR) repeat protein
MSSSSIDADAAAQHNEQGNAAYKAGRLQEALEHYLRAASCSSSTAKYHTNRANTHMKLNQPKQALEAADSSITADATWVKGHFWKTAALEELGRLKKALQSCKAGLAVDPGNADLSKARTRIAAALAMQRQQQQRRAEQIRSTQNAQQHASFQLTEEELQGLGGLEALGGITNDDDLLGLGTFQHLRNIFVNAGSMRGRDGSPHPFGWTGGLQPLEKRGDWLVDCYRLHCTDDAAAGADAALTTLQRGSACVAVLPVWLHDSRLL